MKRLLELFRGARKIEIFLMIAAAAMLLLQFGSTSGKHAQTDLESRLTLALRQIEGVGEVHVMIVQQEDETAQGVLVVADGADDVGVCLRIQYAVKTLLGVESSEIEVMKKAR